MLGHMLDHLTLEEEDRVLCTTMKPGSYLPLSNSGPCLISVIMSPSSNVSIFHRDYRQFQDAVVKRFNKYKTSRGLFVTTQYDFLCHRLGTDKANAIIRNRILANQVKRALTSVRRTKPCLTT